MKMDKILQTCIEMFNERKYEIISINDKMIHCIYKEDHIYLFNYKNEKLDIGKIRDIIQMMTKFGSNHCIVVYKDSITASVKKIIEDKSNNFEIETFTENDLSYNITKHVLVPRHEKVDDDEAKKLKKQYGTKFPNILLNDPIVKFYNFKCGNIIKITRKDNNIIYRIVK